MDCYVDGMISDLANDPLAADLSADVCIIGAGVAGQTLAMRLAKSNRKILLVESGGRDFDAQTQKLSGGENIGEDYYDLETTRLRLFGGTAAIWGGRCAELDPIDFEQRDYLPHSGWPITKADLDPYYEKAYAALGLERAGENRLWPTVGREKPEFDASKLDTDLWCFDENGERFTNVSRGHLDRMEILLNATLTELDVAKDGEVRTATLQSLNGNKVTVAAKTFVLAAGAIETIRLLMAAVPNRPEGLGNETDQLGRFFMEHPHARGGEIKPKNLGQSLMVLPRALRVQGKRYAAYLRPAESFQREAGILNTSLSLAPRRHEGDKPDLMRAAKGKLKHDLPSTKFWRSTYKRLKTLTIKLREMTDPWPSVFAMKKSRGKLGLYAVIRAEQAPNPDSRITLSEDKDALGLPLAKLDWQYSEIDKRSVRVLMETLRDEYGRLGWGEVELAPWLTDPTLDWKNDPLISSHPIGGYHHMGGTRMSATPATGVVNADCRLHASPNLYIASSSVFPTGGWANPTVTIMALAERLGDHIDGTL